MCFPVGDPYIQTSCSLRGRLEYTLLGLAWTVTWSMPGGGGGGGGGGALRVKISRGARLEVQKEPNKIWMKF